MRRWWAFAAVLAVAPSSAAPAVLERDVATTTTTSTATVTNHVTMTDHVTLTETDTETETKTVTAYVIAELPPCATAGSAVTTIQPESPQPSPNSHEAGSASGQPGSGPGSSYNKDPTAGSTPSTDSGDEPAPVLKPTIPNTVDPSNVDNLHPKPNQTVVLTPGGGTVDPSIPHYFAEANMTFNYPTVILPYSAYVSNMSCAPYGLDVAFSSLDAYNFAKSNWTTYGSKGFLLVTPSLHCNAADDGEHVYWLVHKLVFDDATKTVHVTAEEIAVENAVGEISLIWGYYNPPGTGSSGPGWNASVGGGTVPGTGAGTGGSGGGGSGGSTGNSTIPTPGHGGPAPTPGNGTNPYLNISCANPPAEYKGLPTAPCGPDFDDTLDSKIGFFDFDDPESLAEFFPNVNGTVKSANGTGVTRRSLRQGRSQLRRAWYDVVGDFFEEAVNTVTDAVVQTYNDVVDTAVAIVDTAATVVDTLVDIVEAGLTILSGEPYTHTTEINIGPGNLVDSAFGEGNSYLLYQYPPEKEGGEGEEKRSLVRRQEPAKNETKEEEGGPEGKVSIYCVDCGIHGSNTISGQMKFSLLPPEISELNVGISGSLKAELNIGVVAEAEYKKSTSKEIISKAIPGAGFSSKYIEIGAVATLSAEAELSIEAEATLLVGGAIEFENYRAVYDFKTGEKTSEGFTPVYSKKFEVSGKIEATATVGLPVELAVKLVIPPIDANYTIGLRNTPSLEAKAAISISNDLENTEDCNNGLELTVSAKNSLYFNYLGDLITLAETPELEIYEGCFQPFAPSEPEPEPTESSESAPAPTPTDSTTTDSTATPTDTTTATADSAETTPDPNDPLANAGTLELAQPTRRANRRALYQRQSNETIPATALQSSATAPESSTLVPSIASSEAPGSSPSMTTPASSAPASATDTSTYNATATEDSDEGYDDSDFDESLDEGDAATDVAGFTDIFVSDINGQFTLGDNENGNLILVPSSAQDAYTYLSQDDVVVGFGDDYSFFFYPDEMETLGVSRIRINNEANIPVAADIIALAPINYDMKTDTPGLYVAYDTNDNPYYLAACSLQGLESKIFLVKDPKAGLDILKQTDLQPVVTGGIVKECVALALVSIGAGFGPA